MKTENFTNKLFLLLVLLTFAGCNKKLSDVFSRSERLEVNEAEFDYLSAKAKIDFEGAENSASGTANIRMQNDSVIWVSLSPGLGIEVARLMINRDSVALIDKINKEYQSYTFAELSKQFDFDINYQLIQSLILGNLIYPYDREKVVKSPKMFAYSQQQGNFFFENFIGAESMKLEKLQVKDTLSKNSIMVNYSEFQLVEEQIFPFLIKAVLSYKDEKKDKTKVEIQFKQTQIESKPLKFPFNIPQRYERK